MSPTLIQLVAALVFGLALLHTFSTKYFEHLAHTRPAHAGLWHLLAEVEVVFGFWAMVMMLAMAALAGRSEALAYLDGRDFTEPLFVFAIMVVAGSRPVLQAASMAVQALVRVMPLPRGMAFFFTALAVVPLLGSLITEPADGRLPALTAAAYRDGRAKSRPGMLRGWPKCHGRGRSEPCPCRAATDGRRRTTRRPGSLFRRADSMAVFSASGFPGSACPGRKSVARTAAPPQT